MLFRVGSTDPRNGPVDFRLGAPLGGRRAPRPGHKPQRLHRALTLRRPFYSLQNLPDGAAAASFHGRLGGGPLRLLRGWHRLLQPVLSAAKVCSYH
jgi:hypothetical protein